MKITTKPHSRTKVYSQDPLVSEPTEQTLPVDSIGTRLDGPRMSVVTGRREFRASADKEGNYIERTGTKRFNQVTAFVAAQQTLDLFQSFAARNIDWAFDDPQLGVIPHAGDGRNAYYARWNQSVSFYSFESRHLGKTVYIAQSADVVSHETGHAILDGMKPQWGKTFDRETKATHEAFGDCASMLLTISRAENRKLALEQTEGDLSKNNLISSIAEEFGKAQRLANRNPHDDKPFLRNANNDFTYKPPSELPTNGSRDELSSESHSFCMIFTRAFYDATVGLYEHNKAAGQEPDSALKNAGERMGRLLAKGVTMASPNRARFADVALAMLRADRLDGGASQKILRAAFQKTEILTEQELEEFDKPLPQGSPEEILKQLGLSELQHQRTVSDEEGLRTLEFAAVEESSSLKAFGLLNAPLSLDVSAGASLTYDESGKLVHIASQKAEAEAEWSGLPSLDTLLYEGALSEARIVPTEGGYKVERLPVFLD